MIFFSHFYVKSCILQYSEDEFIYYSEDEWDTLFVDYYCTIFSFFHSFLSFQFSLNNLFNSKINFNKNELKNIKKK